MGVKKDWSELICDDSGVCTATVYADRIWDKSNETGYLLEPKNERAFNFIAWYATYSDGNCPSDPSRRLEGEERPTHLATEGYDYCKALSG